LKARLTQTASNASIDKPVPTPIIAPIALYKEAPIPIYKHQW